MIKVINLKKYYGHGKKVVKALDDVSLTLPDTGMVFILGKSGSGKTTFLNLIGGLENKTSGQILVDKLDISEFSDEKLASYRNNYLGIIYQHFNLFSDETVVENIQNAIKISSHDVALDKIYALCASLDLKGKENNLINTLSGGQKQRVAIARALINNPQVILADEPTGNLDRATSVVIFDILKEISKTKLVMVISHDKTNAEKYADRIISIKSGKVVSDKAINNDYQEYRENVIEISETTPVDDKVIRYVNKSIASSSLQVQRKQIKFVDLKKQPDFNDSHIPPTFEKGRNKFKISFPISRKFFKATLPSFILTLLVSTAIISVLSLTQTFAFFDGTSNVTTIANDFSTKSILIHKGYGNGSKPSNTYLTQTTSNDLKTLKSTKYTGNFYEILSTPLLFGSSSKIENGQSAKASTYETLYASTGEGTLICNRSYLNKTFGNFSLAAGSLYGLEDKDCSSLIVTDYSADAILNYAYSIGGSERNKLISPDPINDPYANLINVPILGRFKIGAVIKTNYKNTYAEVINAFQEASSHPTRGPEILSVLISSKAYAKFVDDMESYMNVTYSINPNFRAAYLADPDFVNFRPLRVMTLKDEINGGYSRKTQTNGPIYAIDSSLEDDEIYLDNSTYNSIFNTSITEDIYDPSMVVDKTVTLSEFDLQQSIESTPKLTGKFKIKGLFFHHADDEKMGIKNCFIKLPSSVSDQLRDYALFSFGYILDNPYDYYYLNNAMQKLGYYTFMMQFKTLEGVKLFVDIFNPIFIFIAVVLIGALFAIIVFHSIRIIKKNQYRIGVYKSLGYVSMSYSLATVYNIIILTLSILIASFLAAFFISPLLNSLLTSSFVTFGNFLFYSNLSLIVFSPSTLSIYLGVLFVICIVAIVGPLLWLKRMKSNLIIKEAK